MMQHIYKIILSYTTVLNVKLYFGASDAAPKNSVYEYNEITAPFYRNKIN